MTTFDEFCQHYNLDADNPDLRGYRQYLEAGDLMLCIVGGDREKQTANLQDVTRAESNQHSGI